MNVEQLEQFVMDTIDVIFNNPGEYEAEACKSTVAYRFELHRKSINKLSTHRLPSEKFTIQKPKTHTLTKKQVEEFLTEAET